MSEQLTEFLNVYGRKMEDALLHELPHSEKPGTDRLNKAVHYAVFPSGKRMRPLFTLLATQTVGGNPDRAIPIACAIEYVHTCSLIFDDLPAMDNALERRGRRPVYQVFGEDVAMLAALAFLNQGYAIAARVCFADQQEIRLQCLLEELANCIGPNGMIGGQFVDLRLRKEMNEPLRPTSYIKTTALMRLMLTAGAMIGGASEAQIRAMAVIGEHLGAAYQMLDDIVDELEDSSNASLQFDGPDIQGLWQKANLSLDYALRRLNMDLADNSPALLIELAESIFSKIKKQAADRLAQKKWEYPSAASGGVYARPR